MNILIYVENRHPTIVFGKNGCHQKTDFTETLDGQTLNGTICAVYDNEKCELRALPPIRCEFPPSDSCEEPFRILHMRPDEACDFMNCRGTEEIKKYIGKRAEKQAFDILTRRLAINFQESDFKKDDDYIKSAEERIKKLIEERKPFLRPSDSKRWNWGYSDGLEDALRIISGKGKEGSH